MKNWFFNRGRKPENIKRFRNRRFTAQDVYNRACREEITQATRDTLQDPALENISDLDEQDETIGPSAPTQAFIGVRQKMLSKMFNALSSPDRKRYAKIADDWTKTQAPLDLMKKYTLSLYHA